MNYKPLETEFTKKGFRLKQLWRDGDVAVFHKVRVESANTGKPFDAGFETVVIGRHNGYELGGVKIEPAETYPGDSQWGTKGWSYTNLWAAECKYNSLRGKPLPIETEIEAEIEHLEKNFVECEGHTVENTITDIPTGHRGRPRVERPNLLIPGGEFSVKDLAEQNKTEYSIAFVFIKEKEQAGLIKRTREERRAARGKMTQLFAKVS